MNVLIIEDEQATARRLENLLKEIEPDIVVLDILDSIESSIVWLSSHPAPDLIFQDIHLADGSGFEIYRNKQVDIPVIFTTAYDAYAIDAFKVNSIDYLLKPVSKNMLSQALDKFKKLQPGGQESFPDYSSLQEKSSFGEYQKRFMVRYGQKLKVVETDSIAYFYTLSGSHFFKVFDGHEYPSDFSLDKLENKLDPDQFFRINRQFIINIKAIAEMYAYSKSRVKIELKPPADTDVISSTERSGKFKKWLSGEK